MGWTDDILGPGFEAYRYESQAPAGGIRRATLVRYRSGGRSPGHSTAVLFLHGWSDYFFNTELAGFWDAQGYDFYALDLHNHGRNIEPGVTAGYVADLADYDAEIGWAIETVQEDRDAAAPAGVILMGHSTGGLIAALWASRHPRRLHGLILDSPWLEMHGGALVRRVAQALLAPAASIRPEAVLRLPRRGFYFRSISDSADGEWALDQKLRPPFAFPVRVGWLRAVFAGHAAVARGLGLEIPVLVLISSGSSTGMVWNESMRRSDAVLDVRLIGLRAMSLGKTVTIERIDGALHDVFLSAPDVRGDTYARVARWLKSFLQ